MPNEGRDITQLLQSAGSGDPAASAELLPLVYEELRALAAARLRNVPAGQTLQPTALVHEAYLKLLGGSPPSWSDRRHFFFAAARAMHNILVDQARRKSAARHGGGRARADAANLADALEAPAEDMLALGDALRQLEQARPRQHQIVLLRFFGGLSIAEIAELIGVDERTVRRDWLAARLELHRHLRNDQVRAELGESDEDPGDA